MKQELVPMRVSSLNLRLSFSSCLSLQTNLRSAERCASSTAPDIKGTDSEASGIWLVELLEMMHDAPGVHEKGMKFDSFCNFCNENRAESGEGITKGGDTGGVCC